MLTPSDRARFEEDGFILLKGVYDVEKEIAPILKTIHSIIGICLRKYSVDHTQAPFSLESFDDGYLKLLQKDRAIGAEIYDAVKQVPAFLRLAANEKNEKLMKALRATDLVGVVDRGCGIRMDNPGETDFLTGWHQDYHGHMRSLDGVVMWSPLRAMTPELGPVKVCHGSQKAGLLPVTSPAGNSHAFNTTRYGTALRIVDERRILARYKQSAPLLELGDLLIADFLVIHGSSLNQSALTRWSMQIRWFNFQEETGIRMGWPKSYAHGKSFADHHPELLVPYTPELADPV